MTGLQTPNAWVSRTIERLVCEAPENRLADFDGQPIFDAPLVGVADGDDPLFEELRAAVGERHFLPRDILRQHAPADADLTEVRVVAWALPFTAAICRSNRDRSWPSRLYSAARNNGGALNFAIRERLTELLRDRGYAAAAPVSTEQFDAFRSAEHTFASTWSERHVAYVAGLGQFGLTGALITPLGSNVRLGSVVTNLPVERTPRCSHDYRAPCLASGGAVCGRCVARCPVGAISDEGLDKTKCYAMRGAIRERCMEEYTRTLHLIPAPIAKSGKKKNSYSLGCALCQSGVPCESCLPRFAARKAEEHARH